MLSAIPELAPSARAQVLVDGRLRLVDADGPPVAGGRAEQFLGAVWGFASLPGSHDESMGVRTWETDPAGWFRFSGRGGTYALGFSDPAGAARPAIRLGVVLGDGDRLTGLPVHSRAAIAGGPPSGWDPDPVSAYYQPFVAGGASVTGVGFRLATDGVDGGGPLGQDFVVSVHRVGAGDPDTWEQVGPAVSVPEVDCGGPKQHGYAAGWNSGEVPVEDGATYAVRIATAVPGGTFQAYWTAEGGDESVCWSEHDGRVRRRSRGIWTTVAGDGRDGILIPMNKRVHRSFREFAGFADVWAQTWVAQGRSVALVVCQAAVSGTQPPLSRQRVRISVREGSPAGPPVGVSKIGIGVGNYTGDASWGVFGAVFHPGEVPLVPGRTYALVLQSLETEETIGNGFVNINGVPSNLEIGFNPYRKDALEPESPGTAWRRGAEAMPFDLDLQIAEYEHPGSGHSPLDPEVVAGFDDPAAWSRIAEGGAELKDDDGFTVRVPREGTGAGHFVREVAGLSRWDALVVSGTVHCTWPTGFENRCRIGIDPTGQTSDIGAGSIRWMLPVRRHGEWEEFVSDPVRPAGGAASVWLAAEASGARVVPFVARFRNLALDRLVSDPAELGRVPGHGGRGRCIVRMPGEDPAARERRLNEVERKRGGMPILVHRGATRFAPENSLDAFNEAMNRGADGVELDIRRSADGVLYLFHDDTLERMTNRAGPVAALTYAELAALRLSGGMQDRVSTGVPTLAAALTLARERAMLLHLDVKESGLEDAIIALLDEGGLWPHVVSVNDANAGRIRADPRCRQLAYKGWFPEESPAQAQQVADFLARQGEMIFCSADPEPVVEALGRARDWPVIPLPSCLFEAEAP